MVRSYPRFARSLIPHRRHARPCATVEATRVCYPSEQFHRCVRQCVNHSRIIAEARCKWPARMEVKGSMRIGRYLSVFFPDLLPEGFGVHGYTTAHRRTSKCADDMRGWSGRTECRRPIASHLGEGRPRRGRPQGGRHGDSDYCGKRSTWPGRRTDNCRDRARRQGRASRIMLNGVSVARRILVKPPAVMTSRSLASPACAPSAEPTSCDSEVGTQIIVEAA